MLNQMKKADGHMADLYACELAEERRRPEEQDESDPAFVHHSSDELPTVATDGISARLIAGEAFGARSPLKTPSETLYADVHLAPGAQLRIDPSYEERALYTIAGEIEVTVDTFGPGQLLALTSRPFCITLKGAGPKVLGPAPSCHHAARRSSAVSSICAVWRRAPLQRRAGRAWHSAPGIAPFPSGPS